MIGRFTPAGTGTDVLDMVHARCRGDILRVNNVGLGGETDYLASGQVSARDMRRLRAAGLVSHTRGCWADDLALIAGWDGTADTFVTWYFESCLAGLAQRADGRTGTAWEDRQEPTPDDYDPTGTVAGDLPAAIVEYLLRLVFGEKADYAAAYAYHVCTGAPCPDDPGTDWARKARNKVESLARKADRMVPA